MDEQRVVFEGPEFVARGRVEAEKAELLKEVREGLAGRASENEQNIPARTISGAAFFPPGDPLLTFLIVLAWLAGGVLLWLSIGWRLW